MSAPVQPTTIETSIVYPNATLGTMSTAPPSKPVSTGTYIAILVIFIIVIGLAFIAFYFSFISNPTAANPLHFGDSYILQIPNTGGQYVLSNSGGSFTTPTAATATVFVAISQTGASIGADIEPKIDFVYITSQQRFWFGNNTPRLSTKADTYIFEALNGFTQSKGVVSYGDRVRIRDASFSGGDVVYVKIDTEDRFLIVAVPTITA